MTRWLSPGRHALQARNLILDLCKLEGVLIVGKTGGASGEEQLLDIIHTNSSSSLVEQKLQDLGFDSKVAISLRNNPSTLTLQKLTSILRTYQTQYVKDFVQRYKNFERGIVENSFDLFTRVFLQHPEGVKGLERHWSLPSTGNFGKLCQNYGKKYYVRGCDKDPNFVMRGAAQWGHLDVVKLMLTLGANDYSWTMEEASKGGHCDIVELMLERGATAYDLAMRGQTYHIHQHTSGRITIRKSNK